MDETSQIAVAVPASAASAVRWRAWLMLGAVVAVLAGLSVLFVDRPLARWVYGQGPALSRVGSVLGQVGDTKWWLIALPIGAAAAWKAGRERVRVALLDVLIGMIVAGLGMVDVVKFLAGRARPVEFFKSGAWGLYGLHTDYPYTSFPSGHSATVAAACMGLTLIWRRGGWAWAAAWAVFAGCRIATGSHYLSDVLVGGYLGALGVVIASRLHRRWRERSS